MNLDQRMRVAASDYLGWAHRDTAKGQQPRVARSHPIIPVKVVRPHGPMYTDCTTFEIGVLTQAFPAARWKPEHYQRLQLTREEPWGGLAVVQELGIAAPVAAPIEGRIHMAQAWKGLVGGKAVDASRGHAFFFFGSSLILQCASWADIDGDGASTDPGRVTWTERTWAKQLERYDEVRIVELLESS